MKKINRMTVAILMGLVIVSVISITEVLYFAHKSKDTSVMEQLDRYKAQLSDKQEKMQTAIESIATCFSNTDTISQEDQISMMNSLKEKYDFSFVARTSADGYAYNNEGTTDIYLGEREYFKEGMQGETTTSLIEQGLVDESNGYILTAVPVYKNNQADGIVHGSYSTNNYFSDLVANDTKHETKILLFNSSGNIIATHGLKGVSDNLDAYVTENKIEKQFLRNLSDDRSDKIDLNFDGIRHCAAGMSLDFANGEFYILIAQPTSSIPFSANGFWHSAGLVLCVDAVILVLLLSVAFAMWRMKIKDMRLEMQQKHYEILNAEQKMYHAIIDETETAIVVIETKSHEVLYANEVALSLFSKYSEQFIGRQCYQCLLGKEKPCDYCPIADLHALPQSREYEINGRKYQQNFKPIVWEGRDAIVEYNHDITEQKKTLALIEQQKELQNIILDTIPAGIMVFKFDENGIQIISTNRSILEMMGMDKNKALGDAKYNITSLTHPDDLHIVMDAAKKLSSEGAYVEYEYRHFFRSRNDYIWVLGQGRSIRNSDGYVYAYVNYTDITARKEVETLQGKLEIARIEAATKTEFFSQMSHDMRTPMNGILGVAELAAKNNNIDELHRDIERIKQSGEYMLSLINDTLDLQRIETGKMKLVPTIVKSQAMLQEVVAMMMPSVKEKNISLDVKVLDDLEMNWYIRVDTLRVKQIISNIISNSVKYTPENGKIEIRVSELKRENMISYDLIQIKDNGVGMSEEFLRNGIFKPFSQEHNDMSMLYPGSGLGLSIVKKLVELMGGSIKVESTLGIGTTFYVYLNMEIVPEEEVVQLEKEKKITEKTTEDDLEGKRILLCEDHPLNAEIAQRLLNKVGCEVERAENGEIGARLFQESEEGYYDAILMDIRMPVMDGFQATKAIRESNHLDAKSIPIIAMSANAYEEDIQKSLDAGMNEHLAKPVNSQLLFNTLSKYLRTLLPTKGR